MLGWVLLGCVELCWVGLTALFGLCCVGCFDGWMVVGGYWFSYDGGGGGSHPGQNEELGCSLLLPIGLQWMSLGLSCFLPKR